MGHEGRSTATTSASSARGLSSSEGFVVRSHEVLQDQRSALSSWQSEPLYTNIGGHEEARLHLLGLRSRSRGSTVDEDIDRGVDLATSVFLTSGESAAWHDKGPRNCVAPLPLDMIIKCQQDMCLK